MTKAIFSIPLTKGVLALPDLRNYQNGVDGPLVDGCGYSLLEEPTAKSTAVKALIDSSPATIAAMIADKQYGYFETLPEPKAEPVDAKIVEAVYEVLGKFTKATEYAAVKAETDAKYLATAVDVKPVEEAPVEEDIKPVRATRTKKGLRAV